MRFPKKEGRQKLVFVLQPGGSGKELSTKVIALPKELMSPERIPSKSSDADGLSFRAFLSLLTASLLTGSGWGTPLVTERADFFLEEPVMA